MKLLIKTDLFEHEEVKANFINPCCFGEDFASWLKQQLLNFPEPRFEISEPIQEDYGWGLRTVYDQDHFWIAISYVANGPQTAPSEWIVSVAYDPGFNLSKRLFHKPDLKVLANLQDRVSQILSSNDEIKIQMNES